MDLLHREQGPGFVGRRHPSAHRQPEVGAEARLDIAPVAHRQGSRRLAIGDAHDDQAGAGRGRSDDRAGFLELAGLLAPLAAPPTRDKLYSIAENDGDPLGNGTC